MGVLSGTALGSHARGLVGGVGLGEGGDAAAAAQRFGDDSAAGVASGTEDGDLHEGVRSTVGWSRGVCRRGQRFVIPGRDASLVVVMTRSFRTWWLRTAG